MAPLVDQGIAVTVVAHFNQIDQISGNYSKEGRVNFRKDNIGALNADILWVERQDDAAIIKEMEQLEGGNWFINTPLYAGAKKNLMHQLHSLSRVSQLLHMANTDTADVFFVLRADLMFLDDLDVWTIHNTLASGEADIITPNWQKWNGMNDRFAFLAPHAVHPILNRRSLVGEFSKKHGFIEAEQLLHFAALQHELRPGFTSMRAERVRGKGRVHFEPFSPQ